MIRKNKGKLLLSSAVILSPVLVGLLLWDILPVFAIFVLPLFILAVHWFCVLVTAADPKNKDQTKKTMGLIFWLCPVISLFSATAIYAAAFGAVPGMKTVTFAGVGLVIAGVGNYLPKCKQNYTMGVKTKWTLENEENWNATHRFTGRVWVVGGLLLMFCAVLPGEGILYVLTAVGVLLIVPPFAYSYAYHRRQERAGTATVDSPLSRRNKRTTVVALCITGAVLLGVGYLLFTGDIAVEYGEESFAVTTAYWADLTIDYADIENLEYREQDTAGTRTNGFGSPRLQMGSFQNDEYGSYTRYTYTKCDSCVVLTVSGEIVVLGGRDEESTRAIYDELTAKTGEL